MLKLVGETTTSFQVEEHSSEDINDDVIKYHLIAKEDLKALFQVVNRPLKEEEIHSDMWVWDNAFRDYIKLDFVFNEKLKTYHCIGCKYRQDFIFEQGRYYRYKPLESED